MFINPFAKLRFVRLCFVIVSGVIVFLTPSFANEICTSEYYTFDDLLNYMQQERPVFYFNNASPPAHAKVVLPKYSQNAYPDFYNENYDSLLGNFKIKSEKKGSFPQITRFEIFPDKISLGQAACIMVKFDDDDNNTVFYALAVSNGRGGNIDHLSSVVFGTTAVREKNAHVFYANKPTEATITLYARDLDGNCVRKQVDMVVTKY